MKFHKQEEQGVGKVCRVWEQYGDERAAEAKKIGILEGKKVGRKEMAANLLKDGTLSVQKIAEISGFSLEQLQEIVDEMVR